MTADTLLTRIYNRTERDPLTDCLRWLGSHDSKGYGRVRVGSGVYAVHRVVYQMMVGLIPEGYELDHVYAAGCRYRDCINLGHLEPVTHTENIRRRVRFRATALPGRCVNGHPFTEENTVKRKTRTGEGRICRACKNESNRKYRERRRPN